MTVTGVAVYTKVTFITATAVAVRTVTFMKVTCIALYNKVTFMTVTGVAMYTK